MSSPSAGASGVATERVTLSSGHAMPRLGLGTFQSYNAADAVGDVGNAVKAAVRSGYRLIDCALAYNNQPAIGDAIADLIEAGEVDRSDLFVVSKLPNTHHHWVGDEGRPEEALEQTLRELKVDYVDLMLIHWPFAFGEKVLEKPPGVPQPLRLDDGSPNPIWEIKMEYTGTWKAMEGMVASGCVRSIGVSNFTVEQLKHLASVATVPIAANQVEIHPYLAQRELVEHCASNGIQAIGYAPLGSAAFGRAPEAGQVMQHKTVTGIAERVGHTPAQVLIRWSLQRGIVPLAKSANPARIASNADVFGWVLSDADMAAIDALDCGFRCFYSYMKKPEDNVLWHDGKVESGDRSDWVTGAPSK